MAKENAIILNTNEGIPKVMDIFNEEPLEECVANRSFLRDMFLQYEETLCKIFMLMVGNESIRRFSECGINIDESFFHEKALSIINELPLEATRKIIEEGREDEIRAYAGRDFYDIALYSALENFIYALSFGLWYYIPVNNILIEEINSGKTPTEATDEEVKYIIEKDKAQIHLFSASEDIDLCLRLGVSFFYLGIHVINNSYVPEGAEVIDPDDYLAEREDKSAHTEVLEVISHLVKPSTYSMLNSKIANEYSSIQDNLLTVDANGQFSFIGDIGVRQSPKKATKEVFTIISLTYSGELTGKLMRINRYDREVLNSVCSIYQAGNKTMTLSDVFKVMNGNTEKQASQKQKEKILNSLKKLGSTRITMDISAELANNYVSINDSRVTKGTVDDSLLSYTGGMFQTENGQEIYAISLHCEPILMTYSKAKKQLVSFPVELLNTKNISATDDVIVFRAYLLQQIALLKNGERNNRLIKYDSIFNACDIEIPADRTLLKRKKDAIKKLLDSWAEQSYIKGYSEKKEGKTTSGIEIYY